jgi:hypothetical protein
MKGQTVIIEFLLFFIISFSIFSTIGYFFYIQNQYFSEQIFEHESKTLNDLLIIDILKVNECKSCSNLVIYEEIPNKIGGTFFLTKLDDLMGLNTTGAVRKPFSIISPIFNLNSTYSFSGQGQSVNKKAKIIINNGDRTIEVV